MEAGEDTALLHENSRRRPDSFRVPSVDPLQPSLAGRREIVDLPLGDESPFYPLEDESPFYDAIEKQEDQEEQHEPEDQEEQHEPEDQEEHESEDQEEHEHPLENNRQNCGVAPESAIQCSLNLIVPMWFLLTGAASIWLYHEQIYVSIFVWWINHFEFQSLLHYTYFPSTPTFICLFYIFWLSLRALSATIVGRRYTRSRTSGRFIFLMSGFLALLTTVLLIVYDAGHKFLDWSVQAAVASHNFVLDKVLLPYQPYSAFACDSIVSACVFYGSWRLFKALFLLCHSKPASNDKNAGVAGLDPEDFLIAADEETPLLGRANEWSPDSLPPQEAQQVYYTATETTESSGEKHFVEILEGYCCKVDKLENAGVVSSLTHCEECKQAVRPVRTSKNGKNEPCRVNLAYLKTHPVFGYCGCPDKNRTGRVYDPLYKPTNKKGLPHPKWVVWTSVTEKRDDGQQWREYLREVPRGTPKCQRGNLFLSDQPRSVAVQTESQNENRSATGASETETRDSSLQPSQSSLMVNQQQPNPKRSFDEFATGGTTGVSFSETLLESKCRKSPEANALDIDSADPIDIDTLTVKKLKEILKSHGLKVSGNKKELQERLRQHVNEDAMLPPAFEGTTGGSALPPFEYHKGPDDVFADFDGDSSTNAAAASADSYGDSSTNFESDRNDKVKRSAESRLKNDPGCQGCSAEFRSAYVAHALQLANSATYKMHLGQVAEEQHDDFLHMVALEMTWETEGGLEIDEKTILRLGEQAIRRLSYEAKRGEGDRKPAAQP